MIYEQAGICSRTEREVSEGRIENEGRLWRMRKHREGENSWEFDLTGLNYYL